MLIMDGFHLELQASKTNYCYKLVLQETEASPTKNSYSLAHDTKRNISHGWTNLLEQLLCHDEVPLVEGRQGQVEDQDGVLSGLEFAVRCKINPLSLLNLVAFK